MENSAPLINWFPGHMAKTRRLLIDQVRRIDLIIELCDARLPFSSRNPEIDKIAGNRKRIVILNKSDLADLNLTSEWLSVIRKSGFEAYAIDSTRLRRKELIGIIERATKEIADKALERGIRKTLKTMVVGVPNVGKSTFINQICGKGIAQTGDRPGITKNNQWIRITPYLELLDTPGMLWPRLDDQLAARRLCYIGSVKDDIVDPYLLAVSLLEELESCRPDALMDRFHLEQATMKGQELMDAVCKGRGWLLKGNQFDYDRASRIILDEFRSGKLGRITFEKPCSKKEPDQ